MRSYMKVLRGIVLVGQLGISLITPPVVMALLGVWLQRRFGLGTWVILLTLLVGLLTAASSAVRFYRRMTAAERKKEEAEGKPPVVFNRHE